MRLTIDSEGGGEIHYKIIDTICSLHKRDSLIDVGCGFAPQTRKLQFTKKKYIDIVERDLEEANDDFEVVDILELIKEPPVTKKYDVAICLDCIEHFRKPDASRIIVWMERIADTKIFFTPLGDYIIEPEPTNNPDSHKSGWMPEDFEKIGYATIVFPNYHAKMNLGAFFAFKTKNTEQYFVILKQLIGL